MKTRNWLILSLILLITASCGEYQKLLKSNDPDLKYQKAVEYYNDKKYVQAQTLFDDIATYYKGTDRSEDVLNYLSRCYIGQKMYQSAAEYYKVYIRNYPKGRYIIDARYNIAKCYYMDSPDARLDQQITRDAIEYYTQFVDLYPESDYVQQALKERDEMYDKLAQKEYLSARLYYNLGSYLGNNYEACITVARNAMKKYPGSSYQEEFSWLILQSKYQQLQMSVEQRRAERLEDTLDECYSFLVEFPESKHKHHVEKIQTELKKRIK